MAHGRIASAAITCIAAAFVAAGCGAAEPEGPVREGLGVDLAGATYNVFITRQLNLSDPEDGDYVKLPDPDPGRAYYGVFMKVCNEGSETVETADTLHVEDSVGQVYEPVELPEENFFAYRATRLEEGECIPEQGSIPQSAPTGGSLLLFDLPLEATENVPLELIVEAPGELHAEPEELRIELDI